MKPTLKINFCDFWHGFVKKDNYIYNLLIKVWDVEISDTPEVLFYSSYGSEYLQFDCIRVFYTGENVRPDFNGCDFAMTFDFLDDERQFRLPLYAFYIDQLQDRSILTRIKSRTEALAAWQTKPKFCCLVVSNSGCVIRNEFFHALSRHARVDSGGSYCNNVGGPVRDKLAFISNYKFVLAFENSSYPGYTTEKILQPLLVDSTPVYWGNPLITRDFNPQRFINYFNYDSETQLINRLLSLENDSDAAVERLILSRRLRAAGHQPLVAAPLASLAAERLDEYEQIPVFRYPISAQPTRAECQGRVAARGAERFHDWLRSERPDWVHFHTFCTGLGIFELKAARAAGARVLVTNHLASLGFLCQRGTLMQWGESPCDGLCQPIKCAACALQQTGLAKHPAQILAMLGAGLGGLTARLPGRLGTALMMPDLIRHNLALQDRMLTLADRFVLLNRWALEAVVANGGQREKLVLNYLGLSHSSYAAKPGPDTQPTRLPVKVGYFGRIVDIKGVEELARAFTRLPADLPLELEFRGPQDHPNAQAMIGHLREIVRHDRRVTFCPAVASAEAPRILAGYDVLCIPSIWFENGPTVMIEAHAVGTPVLGTRIGAMPEIITDGVSGRLVEPGDVPSLAAALMEIARDPTGTVDRWRRALPRARTMDEIAADYIRLYEEPRA